MNELVTIPDEAPIQPTEPTPPAPSGGCLRSIPFLIIIALLVVIVLLGSYTLSGALRPDPTPTPAPTPPIVTINNIRSMAELATVEMTAITTGENERIREDVLRFFGGREYVLMLIYGDMKAGFDLQDLVVEDLWTDGRRVQLTLPPPKILSTSIDFEQTRVVDYEGTFFIGHEPDFETAVLGDAIPLLEQAAIKAGILERANEYGALYFENHLRALGFEDIRIITQLDTIESVTEEQ